MDNKTIAAMLQETAVLMELAGENPFKSRSYENAARRIERLEDDVALLAAEGRLRELQGVGEALEQKITELVQTGRLEFLENLRAQFPITLFELFRIPNFGPKRVHQVHKELGIDSLQKLEQACKAGELSQLKGFSKKLEQKILDSIGFAREQEDLHLFHRAYAAAQEILAHLKQGPGLIRIELAGSLRRKKEVIKDIDVLASCSDPEAMMEHFVNSPLVNRVVVRGSTKTSVVWSPGIGADLRLVTDVQFPFALAYFTGSKDHNVAMRQRAKARGMRLNEYALLRDEGGEVACAGEEAIFAALDLPYIPPELREDRGEFEAERLPKLAEMADLKGMFHCHTSYSDGQNTVEEMALGAKERGYDYILICDHSQLAAYAGGLTPLNVRRQQREIDKLNKKLDGFRILKGIESDIRINGDLDYEEDVLKTFDLVVASVHSKLQMTEEQATNRLVKAIENPYMHILGHATGRLLLSRQGYPLDFERVFDACVANGVAVEINADCRRLDMDWRHVQRGREKGVKFVIGPDAHSVAGLDNMFFGLGIARKGWLEAGDLLNTLNVEELLAWRR